MALDSPMFETQGWDSPVCLGYKSRILVEDETNHNSYKLQTTDSNR